jgi:hypothetical protein
MLVLHNSIQRTNIRCLGAKNKRPQGFGDSSRRQNCRDQPKSVLRFFVCAKEGMVSEFLSFFLASEEEKVAKIPKRKASESSKGSFPLTGIQRQAQVGRQFRPK